MALACLDSRWGSGMGVVAAAALSLALACGDDSGGGIGDGCTTDNECKGDRICVHRECVDPSIDDEPDGGAGSGGESGMGGGAGASGESGQGGSGGRPIPDDPELEEACALNCQARDAASCEMNIGSVDQCMGQCLVADEINQGYCLEEQTAQYACLASGGYTCVSGYPQQQATCVTESTALSQCHQLTPCRSFCESPAGECSSSGEDCMTECREKEQGFADAICNIYYSQLLTCWTQDGTVCEDDRPEVGNCGAQIAEVADCISSRNEECDGYCWGAEAIGCGSSGCSTDCQAKMDHIYCGSYYRSVIDCAIGSRELNLSCEGGEPTPNPTECMSALDQYEMCIEQNP